jgi:uncharacterized protein (TIGR02302 family)
VDLDAAKRRARTRLIRPLRLTQVGLIAERLARAFWPFWSVLLIGLAALFFGLHETSFVELVWVGAVAWIAGLGVTGFLGLRNFTPPTRAEAVARLDESLPGRPIQALTDTQAIGSDDDASVAVWKAHVQRMAARLDNVPAVPGDLQLSKRDPFALRYVALLAVGIALLFGSVWRVATIGDVVSGAGTSTLAAGPSWEGWIEPPLYTGRPSLYLNDIRGNTLEIPAGSQISLRLYGEVGALTVSETISGRTENIEPASSPTHNFQARNDGTLSIAGDGGREWTVTLVGDFPPSVSVVDSPEIEASGQMSLPYQVEDDYGVIAGTGTFTLDLATVARTHGLIADPDPRDGIEVDLSMPISGDRKFFQEDLIEDFSKHPWVGLPIVVTLTVQDEAGNKGTSEPYQMALPGRRFFEPVAAALIEQRRDLLWTRDNGTRVARIIRTISHRPDDVIRDSSIYLQLRHALRQLENGNTAGLTVETQEDVAEALWTIALNLEEGDLGDAMARLRRAQDQLSEAIRNGASDEEIAELMQELRDAMSEYMRQLAQQQQQNGEQQQAENSQEVTGDQLEQMLQRLQELMEQGRMAEAQQLMEQLRQMMENMQVAQGQQSQQGQSPGEQAMEGLAETLREQQGLSDEAFRDLQEQFNPNANRGESQQNEGRNGGQGRGEEHSQQGQGGQGSEGGQEGEQQGGESGQAGNQGGQQGGDSGEPDANNLAQRQQSLRQELNRQQQNLPGAGTEAGDAARESLGDAGDAMDRAEQDLRQNDLSGAIDNQAQAMEALRESMRNLGEAMAQQQQQQGQQGEAMGQADPNGSRDPLGRDRGTDGTLGSDENLLQSEDVYRRARDLLDEIRRRSGDQSRPDIELEYLRRLLDRF